MRKYGIGTIIIIMAYSVPGQQLMIFIANRSLPDSIIYHEHHSFVKSLMAVGMVS